MPKSRLRIRPGNVTLEILQPIETAEYTRKTKDNLMEKIRDIICKSFYKEKKEK